MNIEYKSVQSNNPKKSVIQTNIPKLRFPEFNEEWEKKKLLELSENGFSNGAFNDPKKVGSGYRIINVKDMYIDGTINIENLTRVRIDEKEFSKNRVEFGDIFFTRSSLVKEGIAHSNINLSDADDLTFDGHLIRMRPIKEFYSSIYLYYNFSTINSRLQFIQRGKTTTMTTIGQEDIATVEISFPTLPEQTKIAEFFTAIDAKIQALKTKKEKLQQYKKGVMQQIFCQNHGLKRLTDDTEINNNLKSAKSFNPKNLRFRQEDGTAFPDWEMKKLGDVLDYEQPTNYLVSSTEYEDKFETPVVTAGKTFILGFTDETNGIFKKENLPVIIFDDFTTATQFVNFPFKAKSSAMKILKAKENTNIKFIYEAMQMIDYETGGHGRHWISVFAEMDISISSLPEQTKIANFLSSLDEKINHTETQIQQTQTWK